MLQLTQKLVNEKCELLRSQNEEISIDKIRKLIGGGVSIIDLAEKVTLYKQDKKRAFEVANNEEVKTNTKEIDLLLEIIKQTLCEYSIKNEAVFKLRNDLKRYIEQEVLEKSRKLRRKQADISNKNDSLETSNLILQRRYDELLKVNSELKTEVYNLKQSYNSKTVQYLEKEATEQALLAWEDFKSIKDQLNVLGAYSKIAAYDKKGVIIIKFPATDFLTQECRAGSSRYLKAKTAFDYDIQAWTLSGFTDILKTLDFLQRNRFVFSKELETIAYHRRKSTL